MTTNPSDAPNRQSLILRSKELQFVSDQWPCPEDTLGRHSEIENLTPVLLNAQSPLVFAIDAPWGGGKTTFFRLWQHYLKSEKKVSLYLNAWESDYSDDPLLPMLSMLDKWLSDDNNTSAVQNAWAKAKQCAPGIIKSTAVAAAKAATFGALDLDKEYEKLASDLAGDSISSLVDGFNLKTKSLEQFKSQLTKALAALPADQQNLIIFIDELDRCKPTYSIEVLERIKHLFNIDRLVFVLAVNRDQLGKSFQGVYGSAFNGHHYLKRFIDIDYHLKTYDVEIYIQSCFKQPDFESNFESRTTEREHHGYATKILTSLSIRFGFSLRDIDQLITRLKLILRSIPSDNYLDLPFLIPMMILRQENAELYNKYSLNPLCANEVAEYLLGGNIDSASLDHATAAAVGYIIMAAHDPHDQSSLQGLLAPWKNRLVVMLDSDPNEIFVETIAEFPRLERKLQRRFEFYKLALQRIELVAKLDIS